MDLNEVSEIISTAKTYLNRLKTLNNDIEKAERQINTTYEETTRNIVDTFSNLKDSLLNALKNRENDLLKEAETVRNEGIGPLRQCESLIVTKIRNTENLIKLGDNLNCGDFVRFNNEASLLGSLPEVPKLKEVPYIAFNVDSNLEVELQEFFSNYGRVFKTAPVQISKIHEKPGGLLVEWNPLETDDDLNEIQEYYLQKAFGDVTNEKNPPKTFCDCYRGPETQHLVKDLKTNQEYSFRVRSGLKIASIWSVPQVATTRLAAFAWGKNEKFLLSHEGKIASPIGDFPIILYSSGAQPLVGNSVEFTVLESDENDCVLGLTLKKDENVEDLRQIEGHSFLVDRSGEIYIDGVEKSTKLPNFCRKMTVSFMCELVNNDKIRVSVDSNDKRVTYDWLLSPVSELYFACHFFSSKWKIMVE